MHNYHGVTTEVIATLNRFGIRIPDVLKNQLPNLPITTSFGAQSCQINPVSEYHRLLDAEIRKSPLQDSAGEKQHWDWGGNVLNSVACKASTLLNNLIADLSGKRSTYQYEVRFTSERIYKLLDLVIDCLVPAVNRYYKMQASLFGGELHPWNYNILDFQELSEIPQIKSYFAPSIVACLPSSLRQFKEQIIESDFQGLWDLNSYVGKTDTGLSIFIDELDQTFISVTPIGSVEDNIYLSHELGHAYFNVLDRFDEAKKVFSLTYTEAYAGAFEIMYTIKEFLNCRQAKVYFYKFLSGICLHAANTSFELYCFAHPDSTTQEKASIYERIVEKIVPWSIELEQPMFRGNGAWCVTFDCFEQPFYDCAYLLSELWSLANFREITQDFTLYLKSLKATFSSAPNLELLTCTLLSYLTKERIAEILRGQN